MLFLIIDISIDVVRDALCFAAFGITTFTALFWQTLQL